MTCRAKTWAGLGMVDAPRSDHTPVASLRIFEAVVIVAIIVGVVLDYCSSTGLLALFTRWFD